jgi:hypothetical protein
VEHRGFINAYKLLVGQHEGKKHLGIRVNRREDNITTELSGRLRMYGLGSPGSGHGQWQALVNTVMNLQVP